MDAGKKAWQETRLAIYGVEYPTDAETQADFDAILRPYRRNEAPELSLPSNYLQLEMYKNKFDQQQLTHAEIEAFKAMNRGEAASVLLRRDKLPSWDQMSVLLSLLKQGDFAEADQKSIIENCCDSTADMQKMIDSLKNTVRQLSGEYVHG